eukprot:COSAG01_NODE_10329_length_2192_cov_1.258481_2_plen_248_part_00
MGETVRGMGVFQKRAAATLLGHSGRARTFYICVAVFGSWFSAYGIRRPWSAGVYEGPPLLGLPPKDALALSATVGYMLGKWTSTCFVPKLARGQRLPLLLTMAAGAFTPLAAFGVLGPSGQCVALLLSAWPLGWCYGALYLYLEGRRDAELLGGAISASFILGSGAAKGVGAALLERGVRVEWMPLATGALYLPALLLSIVLLDAAPEPTVKEVAGCGSREPCMHAAAPAITNVPPPCALVSLSLSC